MLPLCLTGVARDAYDCLSEESKKTYKTAVLGLKQAFPARSVVEAQVQLRSIRFNPESDLDSFIIRLKGLVTTAFPESDADTLMFNYFLQSLPVHFQSKLVADGVSAFDEAVTSIRNMCCATRLSGTPVRQVTSETDVLRKRVEELEARLAQFSVGPSSVRHGRDGRTCFCCGNKGHDRRDCRHRNAACYRCGASGHLSRVCRANVTGNAQWVRGTVPPTGPAQQQRGTPGVPAPPWPPMVRGMAAQSPRFPSPAQDPSHLQRVQQATATQFPQNA